MPKPGLSVLAKQDALSSSLHRIFGDTKAPAAVRGRKPRANIYNQVDIVSPKLCDDIIEYIAPTLEQHKGCTLIDVHPGACLFSSRLHDFLQPKCHLLMEPEEKYFEPFIKPLLDRPGSKYTHTFLAGAHSRNYFSNYSKILDDPSLLPPRPRLAHDDPLRRQLDPSILLIGNLARRMIKRMPGLGIHNASTSAEVEPIVLHQMAMFSLQNELVHRDGLVRMLWWAPDATKVGFFPTSIVFRQPFTMSLDMSARATEVAGTHSLYHHLDTSTEWKVKRHRFSVFDERSRVQVAKRMQEAGIKAPEGRELQIVDLGQLEKYKDSETPSPFAFRAQTVAELQSKIDGAVAWAKELHRLDRQPNVSYRSFKAASGNVEYPQALLFPTLTQGSKGLRLHRSMCLFDLALRVFNIEVNIRDIQVRNVDSEEVQTGLRRQFDALESSLDRLVEIGSDFSRDMVKEMLDQQLASEGAPPILPSDRRPFEPLKVTESEFWPPMGLTLLDLVPKSRDLRVPDLAGANEAAEVCAQMIRSLFTSRTLPLPVALDRLAINAGKDLIPMVPAISDPHKGGRLNPMRLRVRMLTEEMLEGLVKAWFEWPFRPATHQMASGREEVGLADEKDVADAAGESKTVEEVHLHEQQHPFASME